MTAAVSTKIYFFTRSDYNYSYHYQPQKLNSQAPGIQ